MSANALIDRDHLEKYVAGDNALRDEILSIFVEQAEKLIAQFDISQTDEDWKNTAHALKGAARGVGVWALGDNCEEAETLIGDAPAKLEARSTLLVSMRQNLNASIDEVLKLRECA